MLVTEMPAWRKAHVVKPASSRLSKVTVPCIHSGVSGTKSSGEGASSIWPASLQSNIPCSTTFQKLSSSEHNANRGKLTIVINFEAYIVRTVLAAFGQALYSGVGEDVVEVRSGVAGRSKRGWGVGNWRPGYLAAEPARFKSRQCQTITIRRRRSSSDFVGTC